MTPEQIERERVEFDKYADDRMWNIREIHSAWQSWLARAERAVAEKELSERWPKFAIRLASPNHVVQGRTTVDIEINGQWVVLIEEAGDIFCHIIEPLGVDGIIRALKDKP